MRSSKSLLFALGTLALLLSGCMAMCMHGMMPHTSAHQDRRDHQGNAPLVEEMRASEVSIVLEVPPLTAGEESILSVKIYDLRSRAPLAGAQVSFLIQQAEHPAAGSAGHAAHEIPARRAEEAAEKGIYQLKHVFAEAGVYQIAAEVWIDGEDQAASPLVIKATREVGHREHTGHSPGISPMAVLGGIGMALMMGVMMGGFLL